jgi:hypothetical protein
MFPLDDSFSRSAFVCVRPFPVTNTKSSERIRSIVATSCRARLFRRHAMPWNRRHKASTTLSPRTPTLAGRGCPLLSLLSAWSLSSPGQFRSRFFLANPRVIFRDRRGFMRSVSTVRFEPSQGEPLRRRGCWRFVDEEPKQDAGCLTGGRDGPACALPKQHHRVSAPGAPRLGLAIEFARRAIAQYAPQDKIAGRKRVGVP